jgi:iron complex transport system ATP-binding protein
MKEGRFCGDGSREEMLTDEKIGSLFSVPVHIEKKDGYFYATGY